jgi:S-adenosylmethionine hydrolase
MPILTLTSDIGQQDFLVGAVKGQILQVNGAFSIVDITHHLTAFNYPQSAYVCRNAFRNFPEESFHMVLLNLFDTKSQHLLLARHEGQYIGIADNGLLTMILENEPEEVVALPLDKSRKKSTLYFAEVFSQAFSEVLGGRALDRIGRKDVGYKVQKALRPMLGPDWIEGQIIFIDQFENVVVNITREDFEEQRKGRSFRIVFKRDEVIDRISETYADVPEGEKTALFNSAGYLEIAINKGNAAGLFGLQGYSDKQQGPPSPYMRNHLFYQTVKVLFV